MSDDKHSITLNGPVFGGIMTALLALSILAILIGTILTKGELLAWAFILIVILIVLFMIVMGLYEFYKWASRGFR